MNLFARILRWLRKRPQPDHKLRLYQLMRRRGVFVWDPPTATEARELTAAIRHCLDCPDKARCDALFARNDSAGHADFCPNISYIDGLAKDRDG